MRMHYRAEDRRFAAVIAGASAMGALALIIAHGANISIGPQFSAPLRSAALGFVAAVPLLIMLAWFNTARMPHIAAFRESQVRFFADIGFTFTWPRIIIMALAAGLFEELLFRGVLQTLAAQAAPMLVAIVLTNIVFGLLHARTWTYALVAGLIGGYLGVVYWLSGGLWAPITAHALYDLVALAHLRQAIRSLSNTSSTEDA